MKIKAAYLSALLVVSCSTLAAAGPVVDAATRAETLQAEGKTVEALDALDGAVDTIWRSGPLAFRKVVVVNSSSGPGVYEERTDKTFKPDEKMRIYVEPVGFGYGGSGTSSTIGLTFDLSIENSTGQVLAEKANVFSLSTPARANKREFSLTLSFGVPFIRPGEYKATFTVHDQNSTKTGAFDIPFTVVLPTAN